MKSSKPTSNPSSKLTSTKPQVSLVPIPPLHHPSAPPIFDPSHPLIPPFTTHDSSEEEHKVANDFLANTQLAGLYALWSAPHTSTDAVLKLIKETTNVIRNRCKLYNIPYDSSDNVNKERRLRTVSLD